MYAFEAGKRAIEAHLERTEAIKVVITSQPFLIHDSTEVQINSLVRIGGNIACIVSQQESQSGAEIAVSACTSSGSFVIFLFCQILGGIGYLVVVQVDLRTDEEITFSYTEQKPWVYLYTAVPVLTGSIAAHIVLVCAVSYSVEIFLSIFIAELSEDAELVILEEKLRLNHDVQPSLKHECHCDGQYRAPHGCVLWIHAECHQRTTSHQKTEVWAKARTSQNVIV